MLKFKQTITFFINNITEYSALNNWFAETRF